MFTNILLNTDSYKASHYLQYPENTQFISSYIEARAGKFDKAIFFGLQAFIKQYLLKPFTQQDIDEAAEIFAAHGLPFNQSDWELILQDYDGFLPIEIEALPEGRVTDIGTALVQVVNTDARFPWLTSYVETALLRAVWYPTTVATVSWRIKRILADYVELTSDAGVEQILFKLHDFGARGVSSNESAALGGAAHLVNFMGTDTVAGLMAARRYYNADMAGFSIPAAEHSTMTSWGQEREADAYANMLKQFGREGGLLAVVSDSYDIYNAVSEIWGKQLKQQVLESGATLVIRPDSGDPATVVVDILERLYDAFGGNVNSKGYRVLNDAVRVIQGDGINESSIAEILHAMKNAGFAIDNIAFGMGGALLQQVNRDTLSFAMKASAIQQDGKWRDVFKDPVTDSGKRSKKGRLAVVENEQGLETIRESKLSERSNQLRKVFRNGELLIDQSFDDVRALALVT